MQQHHDDIELQLWEYLDGTCNTEDAQRIAAMISSNEDWRSKYAELAALQNDLLKMEADLPSMRFTANVMDEVSKAGIASATSRYLNNWVIRSVAAFFLVLIGATVILSVATTDVSLGSNSATYNLQRYLSSDVLRVIMFINILLALILIDKFMRRQQARKQTL